MADEETYLIDAVRPQLLEENVAACLGYKDRGGGNEYRPHGDGGERMYNPIHSQPPFIGSPAGTGTAPCHDRPSILTPYTTGSCHAMCRLFPGTCPVSSQG